MREESLRAVLLVKAIEEADRTGALITAAERVAASREARRNAGVAEGSGQGEAQTTLGGSGQRMLAARAEQLAKAIVARHPFVDTVLHAAGGPAYAGPLLMLLGALSGVALSSLDGSQRINLLAPGLIGLVLWNLAVYLFLFFRLIRHREASRFWARPIARLLAHNATTAMLRLISRSESFNASLAAALKAFAREWTDTARPLLLARASRVIHLSAAAVGAGMIGGLYARGIGLEYTAGWESTFLDGTQVRSLLAVLYGPASWVFSQFIPLPLPDALQVEALRFHDVNGTLTGGERATKWIHLLAASVALYVVIPRVLLAALASAQVARWSWRTPLPATLQPYFRNVFGAVDSSIGRGIVMVAPYAYEVETMSTSTLRTLLPAAFGADLVVDQREPIAYGAEDDFVRHLPDRGGAIADIVVLLFNLAATPEEENHGTLIAGVRDWIGTNRRQAQLLVLLDVAPYAARMSTQTARVDERRGAWQEFVTARGLPACAIDLSVAPVADDPRVTQLRSALWQPA